MALLRGLACLVVGGASGLGRATAQRLLQHGCRVVIADLPSSEGDRVANDLGEKCIFVPADVRVVGGVCVVGGGGGGGGGGGRGGFGTILPHWWGGGGVGSSLDDASVHGN